MSLFSVWNVVLPLPGYAMKYPRNEQSEWYTEIVKADGFQGLDCFNSKNRSFSMRGSYRKIFCLPGDLQYEVGLSNSDYQHPVEYHIRYRQYNVAISNFLKYLLSD